MAASPLLPVYRRTDIVMVRGEGAYLFDSTGKRYLDFAAGIATNALGHAHPMLTAALARQAGQLWHCSNAFHTPPLDRFAEAITQATGMDQVFFCSSGTEAVEAAIKTVRRHHHARKTGRWRILVAEEAFHGRTMGALSACSHAASKVGFEPLLEGFDVVAFDDAGSLERAITPQTAAILLETIQGEGGIRAHSAEYLQAARALCDQHGMLMVLDEIQCGYGRTGTLLACEESGVRPDMITLAKGIGGGFPLAALLLNDHAAAGMTPGSHGSTYGSNPLAMAVGDAVLKLITAPGFLTGVQKQGDRLMRELKTLCRDFPSYFSGVRGVGLMLGLVLRDPAMKHELTVALREKGLIVAPAVSDVLRILPPLIIDDSHIDEAMMTFRHVADHGVCL